jgi:hypothetical protein
MPISRVDDGVTPTLVDRSPRPGPEIDVILENEDVLALSIGDHLPDLDVRASDSHLLPGHSNRLIRIEGLGKAIVWLDKQLVADTVRDVNVRRCSNSASVTRVHCRKPDRQTSQRCTLSRPKATQLAG